MDNFLLADILNKQSPKMRDRYMKNYQRRLKMKRSVKCALSLFKLRKLMKMRGQQFIQFD